MVRVYLDEAEVQNYGKEEDVMLINKNILEIPIPPENQFTMEKAVQECTNAEIDAELAKARELIATERKRQAIKAGFGSPPGGSTRSTGRRSTARSSTTATGRAGQRVRDREAAPDALAFGSLLFVILGAPVGILFAKRDFLSAFISCFVPIITLYYPLMLLGVNLGKEGMMPRPSPSGSATSSWRPGRHGSIRRSSSTDRSATSARRTRSVHAVGRRRRANPRSPALLGLLQGVRHLLPVAGRPLHRHRRLLEPRRVHEARRGVGELFTVMGRYYLVHQASISTSSAA